MTLSKEMLEYVATLVEKSLGIQYSKENHYQLEKRMNEVAAAFGMRDAEELFHTLRERTNQKAINALLDASTNNETSFFRDHAVFDAFANDLLNNPEFNGNKQNNIRIWSAASSTGQEAYSLAILLRQWQLQKPNRNYEIVVTDFSDRVLQQAKEGKYSDLEVQRGLTPEFLNKHFERNTADPKYWTVRPELKKQMSFRKVNLLEDWSDIGSFDVVFCRNVLIYQNMENKKKIISRLVNTILPDGYLVLGAAETLIGLSEKFEIRRLGKAVYYQKLPKG